MPSPTIYSIYFDPRLITFPSDEGEASKLLGHLATLSSEHRKAGQSLQAQLDSLEKELSAVAELGWPPISPENKASTQDSDQLTENVSAQSKVPKPTFVLGKWRVGLLDI
jgi:hypothetical protein